MLRLEGITAGYGPTTVLRDVTLHVPERSVVTLIGPNGAGKTTLLRVASGLIRPRSGALRVRGEDMTGARPHQLAARGLAHVPEGRGIFPSLTVRENLVLQAGRHQQDGIDRVLTALPRLRDRLNQPAGTMSGGEQQMLALARAYISQPDIVLLDEVSMGLAPQIVDEIFAFLVALAAGGAALLLVEQYVTRALEAADYVYILNRGRVAFAGEPSELDADDVFASYTGTDAGSAHSRRVVRAEAVTKGGV